MAWEMQHKIVSLNEKWRSQGRQEMMVGIGLNTGFVTYGNFGSTRFRAYTVIGRDVNLAARIESQTPGGMILISQRTQAMVQDVAKTRLFAELNFKGIPEPVKVYEVLEVKDAAPRAVEAEEAQWHCDACNDSGPYTVAGLRAMVKSGRIPTDTMVRQVESDKTVALTSLIN